MSQFPEPYEESALPEPSLSKLYGQLAQKMMSLKMRALAWDANAVSSDKNFARFEQFLSTLPDPVAPKMPPAQPLRAMQLAGPVCVAQPLGEGQAPITAQ